MKYFFSGHEKFDCKVDWLSKALSYNKKLVVNEETIMNLGLNVKASFRASFTRKEYYF